MKKRMLSQSSARSLRLAQCIEQAARFYPPNAVFVRKVERHDVPADVNISPAVKIIYGYSITGTTRMVLHLGTAEETFAAAVDEDLVPYWVH